MNTKWILVALTVLAVGAAIWWLWTGESSRWPGAKPEVDRLTSASPETSPPSPPPEGPGTGIASQPFSPATEFAEGSRGFAGRVVDINQGPVAGARVLVMVAREQGRPATHRSGFLRPTQVEVQTDAAGSFRAALPPEVSHVDVLADKPGLQTARKLDVRVEERPTLILGAPFTLSGEVVTLEETPIVGVPIRLRMTLDRIPFERNVVSDAKGRFELIGVPPPEQDRGGQAHLWIDDPRYAPLWRGLSSELTVTPMGRWLRVTLSPGSAVEGQVFASETKQPVAGAKVALWSSAGVQGTSVTNDGMVRNPWGSRIVETTRSDPEGRFRFLRIPRQLAGEGMRSQGWISVNTPSGPMARFGGVVASAPGYANGTAAVTLAKSDGEVQKVEILLPPALEIEGRVVGLGSQGVGGVRVQITAQDPKGASFGSHWSRGVPGEPGELGGFVIPDEEGRYVHGGVPPPPSGSETLTIHACTCDLGWVHDQTMNVSFRGGSSLKVEDLVLPFATERRRGLVHDENGAPILGALVYGGLPPIAATDRDGRFDVGWIDLKAAEGWSTMPQARDRKPKAGSLAVLAPGYLVKMVSGENPDLGTIRLERAHTLKGHVRDRHGVGISNLTISLKPKPGPADAEGWNPQVRTSGPLGEFEFGEVPALPATLTVHSVGAKAPLHQQDLEIPSADLAITVTMPEPKGTIRLEIRDTHGTVVPDVGWTATAYSDGIPPIQGSSRGPGLILFEGLAAGRYEIACQAPGKSRPPAAWVSVHEGRETPVEIRTLPGSAVRVRTKLADGSPISADIVHAVRALDTTPVIAQKTGEGEFVFESLSEGEWVITASKRQTQVHVATPVRLRLPRTSPVEVEITLESAVLFKLKVEANFVNPLPQESAEQAREATRARLADLHIMGYDESSGLVGWADLSRTHTGGGIEWEWSALPGPLRLFAIRRGVILAEAVATAPGELRFTVPIP